MGRKKYNSEEERIEGRKEYRKRWRERNLEHVKETDRIWRENNEDKIKAWRDANPDYRVKYRGTKLGRAKNLANDYERRDKEHNRGESTITYEWILENIFNGQCCVYCGEPNWKKLGCDRKDNSLPHTPDNVVPCCGECNTKKGRRTYDEYMRVIGKIV